MENYKFLLTKFASQFGERELASISSEEILSFLSQWTESNRQSTKNTRYSHLRAFFNFISNGFDPELKNSCDSLILRKLFKPPRWGTKKIFDKESIDEVIFRTQNKRNRLLLELQARAGMRIGEVLKLTPQNVEDRKLIIEHPKSGRESEVVFIPRRVAKRLKEYIGEKGIKPNERIFPITYSGARWVIKKIGTQMGLDLNAHDLRRHAATFASRAGIPLEIVSKIILRHANLSTTQRYLGKVSDSEALRWIENLYG